MAKAQVEAVVRCQQAAAGAKSAEQVKRGAAIEWLLHIRVVGREREREREQGGE